MGSQKHIQDSRGLWPVHKWEHVERYSARLLSELHYYLSSGVILHGEIFSSSVCSILPWCSLQDLRDLGHTYDQYDGSKTNLSKVRQGTGKWYHASFPPGNTTFEAS